MTSPRVSFLERTESLQSIHSTVSCLEDIFENEDVLDEDLVQTWQSEPAVPAAPIFTVGNGDHA